MSLIVYQNVVFHRVTFPWSKLETNRPCFPKIHDILHEPLAVKSKRCASFRKRVLRIVHLFQLVSIIVIAVHWNYHHVRRYIFVVAVVVFVFVFVFVVVLLLVLLASSLLVVSHSYYSHCCCCCCFFAASETASIPVWTECSSHLQAVRDADYDLFLASPRRVNLSPLAIVSPTRGKRPRRLSFLPRNFPKGATN